LLKNKEHNLQLSAHRRNLVAASLSRCLAAHQLLLCRCRVHVLGPSHHGGAPLRAYARCCTGMLTLLLRHCTPHCPGHRLTNKAVQHHAVYCMKA
jgi:hypothetical protein